MMKQRVARAAIKSRSARQDNIQTPLTFLDHIRELQGRLFWIAMSFVLISIAAYPFFDVVVRVIVAPLGEGSELVYLTPGGAFAFIMQACMSIGLIGSLPVVVYHIYKFVAPTVHAITPKKVATYVTSSALLAVTGVLFAYHISLPAALYFLTNFDMLNISPMLTIDSYFSFVMAYLGAGALLFQLPLVLLMINTLKPLSPRSLMGYQKHVLVGSFAVAALISPTPDAFNQTILAVPPVIMYQVGILLVMLKNKERTASPRDDDVLISEAELALHYPLPVAQNQQSSSLTAVNHQPAMTIQPIAKRASPLSHSGPVLSPKVLSPPPQPVRTVRPSRPAVIERQHVSLTQPDRREVPRLPLRPSVDSKLVYKVSRKLPRENRTRSVDGIVAHIRTVV